MSEEASTDRAQESGSRHEQKVNGRTNLRRAKWNVGIGLAAVITFAAAALVFIVLIFLPYTPMKIYYYDIKPSTACPNELLKAQLSYSIEKGTVIDSADAQAIWIAVDVDGYEKGERLVGATAPIPVNQLKPGRSVKEGEILRPAPVAAGKWQFSSELVLHGRSFTQIQRITSEAESVTTVLDRADPRCEGA